ncbi:hypothetical protein FISHEDRAFT_74740 [Fistulina hepatica ATCC 64428]|uniref:Uncharacterized protein n=1 Tax=Fistulina hepatica ATCC 64428 TaxID=1128425 RepID=A0A0D7ABN6_9AGAR|nr:hypothetical protein FISHEDRAFT_74740 [Fistulina hepatica ATCC 64428]
MQFLSGIFATALLVFTGVARGASLYQRGDTDLISRENIGADCYAGVHGVEGLPGNGWITPLAYACEDWIAQGNTQMWSSEICVAAASVAGVSNLRDFCVCIEATHPDIIIPSQTDLESLNYDVRIFTPNSLHDIVSNGFSSHRFMRTSSVTAPGNQEAAR